MLYKSNYRDRPKGPIGYIYLITIFTALCSGFFLVKMMDSFHPEGGHLDIELATKINGIRTESLNNIFTAISRSGDSSISIILTAFIMIFLYYKKKHVESLLYGINIAGTAAISQTLKMLIKRPRPKVEWLVDISKYTHVGKYSFPSGHTMIAVSGSLLLVYFILTMMKNKTLAVILSILILAYSILISISRLYVGVHYLSDVLAGCIISSIWVIFLIVIYRKYYE